MSGGQPCAIAARSVFPRVALIFYINHLSVEVLKSEELFEPKAA